MKLYKYVSLDTAMTIADTNTIGFSNPMDFNDPFEMAAGAAKSELEGKGKELNAFSTMFRTQAWAQNSAALCLTRSFLNPLMWAHYGDSHKGVVFGYKGDHPFFTSLEKNLIPAQHGSVIYSATKPGPRLLGRAASVFIDQEYSFRPEALEMFQRWFLYKPSYWSYEEEVRIVKGISGIDSNGGKLPSGDFQSLPINGRLLRLLSVPSGALSEVLLGAECLLRGRELSEFAAKIHKDHPTAIIRKCRLRRDSWQMLVDDKLDC